MSNRAEMLKKALSLPPCERAELAERLLSSLDPPTQEKLDELWAAEAEDRLDAIDRGEIEAVPAEQVFEQAGCEPKRTSSET
jgi:putative addiction module component (TIGR02574 family)